MNTTAISYDFAGNPTSTVVTGVRPGGGTTYDTRERPSSTVSVQTIGGVEKARNTTAYSYDALGRQSSVSSGPTSSADLLESQYGYTLQQWTSSLTTELDGRTVFSETLGYDSPSNSLGGPSYTGLITRKNETWTIPTGPSPSQVQPVSRTEDYAYDYAARLSTWDDSSNGENISYDARGNITSRSPRYGSSGTITLTYTGDRLSTRKVGTGTAVSFAHDSFARMTTDAEAGLSITYNALDLPETVSMGNTLKAKYTYLSDGTKVSALDASGAGLVYRGPFTYRRSSGGTLAFESAPFDSGRLTEAGTRYHVTDHLGSVRAVIDGNASTTTYPLAGFYSVDDFAPFGVKSASSASSYLNLASTGSTVSLRDGFTGQEDQMPDFGVGYSDFGARQYSPSLSRWLVPDPMGEKYYDVSPYAYCYGNPIHFIDSDGKFAFVPILIKMASGAIVDLTIQVALNRITSDSFGEAFNKVDWTSVGASALIGPTSSLKNGRRLYTVAVALTDAGIDCSFDKGLELIGRDKEGYKFFFDVFSSLSSSLSSDRVVKMFKEEYESMLKNASYMSPLTKAEKESVRKRANFVNTDFFETIIQSLSYYMGGSIDKASIIMYEDVVLHKEDDEELLDFSFEQWIMQQQEIISQEGF